MEADDMDPFNMQTSLEPEHAMLEQALEHVELLQQQLNKVNHELNELRQKEELLEFGIGRLHGELADARRLQHSLLAQNDDTIDNVKITKLFLPAGELSGDMFDILRLDPHRVAIHLSDATGHGVASAMLGMYMKQALRAQTMFHHRTSCLNPQDILQRLNHELIDSDLPDCQFVTNWYGIYEPSQRRLTWARGGGPYPVLLRPGEAPRQIKTTGMVLGVFQDQCFEQTTLQLNPGDCLLVFTDGLEAFLLNNHRGPNYPSILHTPWCQSLTPEHIKQHLKEIERRIELASNDEWPVDDITVLALHVT